LLALSQLVPLRLDFGEEELLLFEYQQVWPSGSAGPERWLRDNQERLQFPFKLVEVRRLRRCGFLEAARETEDDESEEKADRAFKKVALPKDRKKTRYA
jgi:hypothetical protein